MKKKKYSYLKTGLGMIGGAVVVGSIPNISGTASETTMKNYAAQGFGNMASTLPAQGSLVGTGMVLKQVRKLRKKTKF